MESYSERLHPGFIAAGYAAVCLVATILLYNQHVQHVRELHEEISSGIPQFHPQNNWLLGILIGGMFLLPTFPLVWVIRESETAYTTYARVLLVLSITEPACVLLIILMVISALPSDFIVNLCLYRFLASPAVIVGLLVSRFVARFSRAKRLILYALCIEAAVFVAGVVFVGFVFKSLSALR